MSNYHGRVRVDEWWRLKHDNLLQQSYLREESEICELLRENEDYKKHFENYFKTSSLRKDPRSTELPEIHGDYEYYTKHSFMGKSNTYEIICRRNLRTGKDESVLDLARIPMVQQKYQETARLTNMSISDDHRYLIFGIDLLSNEEEVFMLLDTSTG